MSNINKIKNLTGLRMIATTTTTANIEMYAPTSSNICIKQYASSPETDTSATRTMTLLDGSGNTNIPGSLSIGGKTLTSFIIDTIYPLGAVFVANGIAAPPANLFPNTAWEEISGTGNGCSYYKRTG